MDVGTLQEFLKERVIHKPCGKHGYMDSKLLSICQKGILDIIRIGSPIERISDFQSPTNIWPPHVP